MKQDTLCDTKICPKRAFLYQYTTEISSGYLVIKMVEKTKNEFILQETQFYHYVHGFV